MSVDDVTLVYHPVPPDEGSDAFSAALESVLHASEYVAMAAPYLSGDLVRAIARGRQFRLVTDQAACAELGTGGSLIEFLKLHEDRIRSVRGLHAKAVLGARAALLGSANLTKTAFCQRFELGCIVRGSNLDEIWSWFESLWAHASPINIDELIRTDGQPPDQSVLERGEAASAAGLPVTGSLSWLAGQMPVSAKEDAGARESREPVDPNDVDQLATRLAELTSDQQTAKRVLDMLREALVHAGLSVHDDRLHLNFSRAGRISITVGQRHVAWCRRQGSAREFGMMLQSFDIARRAAEVLEGARLKSYTRQRVPVIPELYVPVERLGEIDVEVLEDWKRSIRREVSESGSSSYRLKKRVALYHILFSDDLQLSVLARAHPKPKANADDQ